jgi:hypothetical protein
MIRIKPSLAATARSVFAQDRIRNTGRDDFRRPETRSRDGMPGIFSADPICLRPRRGEPETIAVSRRFFPNHCVDPTASGPVAPRLRLSPAVDHARRSGEDEVMTRTIPVLAAAVPTVLAPDRRGTPEAMILGGRRRSYAMARRGAVSELGHTQTRAEAIPRPFP